MIDDEKFTDLLALVQKHEARIAELERRGAEEALKSIDALEPDETSSDSNVEGVLSLELAADRFLAKIRSRFEALERFKSEAESRFEALEAGRHQDGASA